MRASQLPSFKPLRTAMFLCTICTIVGNIHGDINASCNIHGDTHAIVGNILAPPTFSSDSPILHLPFSDASQVTRFRPACWRGGERWSVAASSACRTAGVHWWAPEFHKLLCTFGPAFLPAPFRNLLRGFNMRYACSLDAPSLQVSIHHTEQTALSSAIRF